MKRWKKTAALLLSILCILSGIDQTTYAQQTLYAGSGMESNSLCNITTHAENGGSITPSFTVDYGDKAQIDISLSEGYEIAGFTVNGESVELNGLSYEIEQAVRDYDISVTFRKKSYKVTLDAGKGGSITGSRTVLYGESADYQFVPDAGYELDKVYLDEQQVETGENGNYTLMDVKEPHVFRATFKEIECGIKITSPMNGTFTVTCDGKAVKDGDILKYGSIIEMSNTPDAYYNFAYYQINGEQYMGSEFRVKGDVHITAVFTEKVYAISSKVQGNGTVLTEGKTQVTAGEKVLITAIPDTGYTVTKMLVNGNDVTENMNENFTYEASDTWAGLSVIVTFEKLKFDITTGCGEHGTVTSSRIVSYGDDVIISFRADEGYEIDKVYVDGELVPIRASDYTFEEVVSNHEIYVEFKEKYCTVDIQTGEHGSASSSKEVAYNGEYLIEIYPDKGYQIDEIFINGTPVYATNNQYLLSGIKDDCIVKIEFEPNEIAKAVITSVKSKGVHELLIEWNTIDRAEGYEIYRRAENQQEYELIADVAPLYFGQSYTDNKRICGVKYYYRIKGYRVRHGEKVYGELSDYKSGSSKPGKVEVKSVTVLGMKELNVKWNQIPGANGYEIYMSKTKTGSYSLAARVTGNKTLSKNLTGLQTGTRYYLKIRAYRIYQGKYIYGSFSSVKNNTTAHLKEVSGVKAKMKGFEYARVTWKKISGADGYDIYWCATKGGRYERIATVKGKDSLEYRDMFYFTGRNYYKVRAYKMVNGKKVYGCLSKESGVNAVIRT